MIKLQQNNNIIVGSLITVTIHLASIKEKLVCQKSKLSFSTDGNTRRELIPNVSNLREGSCHRSYALWKNDLNSLSFNPHLLKSGSIERERNR